MLLSAASASIIRATRNHRRFAARGSTNLLSSGTLDPASKKYPPSYVLPTPAGEMPALPVPERKDHGKDALSHNLPPGTAVLPHNNPKSQMHCEQVQSMSKLIDCLEVHER